MTFSTIEDAIIQVAAGMSLVNAQGMTPYSDELILSYLHGAHTAIADEQEWDEMTISHTRTLDGTTGKITQKITEVTDWKDIERIYHESSQQPLPKVTRWSNPLISTTLVGFRGMSAVEDPNSGGRYLVQFFPLTLTGQVLFQSALSIDFTNRDTVLPIDWWLHVYHASWQYALDDGTNPAQMEKYQTLYNQRLKTVKSKQNRASISLDPYQAIPNIWTESDDPYQSGP